jgi:hypothetical protein
MRGYGKAGSRPSDKIADPACILGFRPGPASGIQGERSSTHPGPPWLESRLISGDQELIMALSGSTQSEIW